MKQQDYKIVIYVIEDEFKYEVLHKKGEKITTMNIIGSLESVKHSIIEQSLKKINKKTTIK